MITTNTVVDANVVISVFTVMTLVNAVTIYSVVKLVLTRRSFWESDQFTTKKAQQKDDDETSTGLRLTAAK